MARWSKHESLRVMWQRYQRADRATRVWGSHRSLEIDLVSHSGASAAGEFLHTLDGVDIQTTWVERQAVMGR